MKRFPLTATLRSPLVVRRERQSQRSDPATSLSGTLVRGALAQLYLQQHGTADERFHRLFLDEERCRYGPLDLGPHVFPLSAAACKREKLKHGVVDLLWLRVARGLLGHELLKGPWLRTMRCHCNQDLKSLDGFWEMEGGRRREAKEQWQRGSDVHVGIDRLTHSAHDEILYALPVLQPRGDHARLSGVLEAGDDEAEQLRRLLEAEDGEVRIGHARTRGYGRVHLTIGPEEAPRRPRLDEWSAALIAAVREVDPQLSNLDAERDFFFSIGLPTGGVLLDAVLRYTLEPSGMVDWLPPLELKDAARPPADGEIRCVAAITGHERLRGWNAVQGLPRQDEWAVRRGAVYAYRLTGDVAAREALRARLEALERDGLGARRTEGLGRVHVSDDFHRECHPGGNAS